MTFSRANIVAGISVVVALASLSLTATVLLQQHRAAEATSAPVASKPEPAASVVVPTASTSPDAKAQVAAAYAKLDVPAGKAELIVDKAKRLRDAIKAENFAAAGDIAAAVQTASQVQGWAYQPFRDLAEDYPDLLDPDFGRHLDNWVAADPQAPLALLLRAQYHYQHGYRVRGEDYAAQVPFADMQAFVQELRQARQDVERSIALADGNPFAYFLLLRILHVDGPSPTFFDAFQRAITRYPDFYPLYNIALETLEPKWGGTTAQMSAFVDKYAGSTAATSPLKLLNLELYRRYLLITAQNCWNNAKPADCVAATLPGVVTPDVQGKMQDALRLYDEVDPSPAGHYRFGLAIEPNLTQMLDDWTVDTYSGAVLQLAATAMHSDTQLKQENPGHNDYMIDRLLARSWLQKAYYENAVTKAGDALKDIAATSFPDETARNQAMADVYMIMSEAYAYLAQYPAAIATAQAAAALGGRQEKDHLPCYGYVQMEAYDAAIEACNATLTRHPDSLTVYYWRAFAEDKAGHEDEALRDYALVANSHHGFRASAVIDMSMIYFNRKDNKGALDLLNTYPYLYDPDISRKSDVAVGYNNRCYAYMELGELQKALADCRQSLKYGSIPDAFRKEQELLKLLGDQAPKSDL